MAYFSMLPQCRRCLCTYAKMSLEEAGQFSLDSRKASALSWSWQLGLSLDLRAAQGHHKLPSARVKKYGRDDVWPQLRCQGNCKTSCRGRGKKLELRGEEMYDPPVQLVLKAKWVSLVWRLNVVSCCVGAWA